MTKLLEKAVEEINKLPDQEKNVIAQIILDEIMKRKTGLQNSNEKE